MTIWQSQSIQIIWFIASVEGLKADQVFEDLLGEEPDNIQRNKTPGPSNPFFSVASGVVAGMQGQVQIQPGRVDLILSGLENGDAAGTSSPQLVDTQRSLLFVLERMATSGTQWPPTLRLSIVANLVSLTETRREATDIALEQVGLNLDFEDALDVSFQVNRRKMMRRYVGEMNRVMRFGVANYQHFMFQMLPNVGMPGQAVPVSQESYAASLSLDINTVPDGRTIEPGSLVAIFGELAEELLRLADAGSLKGLSV